MASSGGGAGPQDGQLRFETKDIGGGKSVVLIHLLDFRRLRAPKREMWLYLRQCEHICYNTSNTTGAFYHLLERVWSVDRNLVVDKQAVTAGWVTDAEKKEILRRYRLACNPLGGAAKRCTLVPLASALIGARHCRHRGLLKAFGRAIPAKWDDDELSDQQGAGAGAGASSRRQRREIKLDALLEDAEEALPFQIELMTTFVEVQEDVEDDSKRYALTSIPESLQKEINEFRAYRTDAFHRFRSRVQAASSTIECETGAIKRFLGFYNSHRKSKAKSDPEIGLATVYGHDDAGKWYQEFLNWLVNERKCKYATCASYINMRRASSCAWSFLLFTLPITRETRRGGRQTRIWSPSSRAFTSVDLRDSPVHSRHGIRL